MPVSRRRFEDARRPKMNASLYNIHAPFRKRRDARSLGTLHIPAQNGSVRDCHRGEGP